MTISTVIFDFGGVISSPLFVGIGDFEESEGYPKGSLLQLLFGDTSYIGVEGRAVAEADRRRSRRRGGRRARSSRRARLAPAREGPDRRRDVLHAARRRRRPTCSGARSTWMRTAGSGAELARRALDGRAQDPRAEGPRSAPRPAHEQRQGVRRATGGRCSRSTSCSKRSSTRATSACASPTARSTSSRAHAWTIEPSEAVFVDDNADNVDGRA